MDVRLAWTLGILGVGAAVVGGVALASAAASQPATPGTTGGNGKACPAPTGVIPLALVAYTAKLAQTGTTLALQVGDQLNVTLLRSSATPWTITADDDSILQPTGPATTQTDTASTGGTDDVLTFKAVAQGSCHVLGSSGGQNFKLTVNVNCPGG